MTKKNKRYLIADVNFILDYFKRIFFEKFLIFHVIIFGKSNALFNRSVTWFTNFTLYIF